MLREFTANSSAHEVKLPDDRLQGRTAYGGFDHGPILRECASKVSTAAADSVSLTPPSVY